MSSEKRIRASRANGALSRGPKTAAGKERSSRNAITHGLLSNLVVLEEEPVEAFEQLEASYLQRFGPLDSIEAGMIHEMLAGYWRMRRAWAVENRIFDKAIAAQDGPSPIDRLTDAFTALSTPGDNRLGLLHRYETRLHMMFQRAFQNFLLVRRQFPAPEAPIPNEPRSALPATIDSAEPTVSDPFLAIFDTTSEGS